MKIMKLKFFSMIFLLVLTFSLSGELFGQGMCNVKTFQLNKIKGRVVSDGPNGIEPIEKAKIELRKVNKNQSLVLTLLTNKEGYFEINKIKNGKYVVSISKSEWRFVDYYFGVDKFKNTDNAEQEGLLTIQLGVSPIEPCGGGFVKLEN
jgi:5-hydroxyisourate hydrolase-like protein (transthyretin family)